MAVLKYTVDGTAWQGLQAGPEGPPGPKGDPGTPGTPGTPGAPGAAGATILSGTATPTGAVGSIGDYYLDTDDRVLYGPKTAGGYGAAYSAHTTQTPSSTLGPDSYSLGREITFTVAGRVTGLRYYRPAGGGAVSSTTLRMWTTGGAALASAATSGEVSGAQWWTAVLATPVAVTAGQTVRVSWDCANRLWPRTTAQPAITNQGLTISAQGWVHTTNASGFPGQTDSSQPFVDVVFEPEVGPWPVALKSVPPGGTTGQILKKTSGADFAVGWVT